MTEFDLGDSSQSFDPERLKALPQEELVEALLDEARGMALRAPEAGRQTLEGVIMSMCHVLSPEEQAALDERQSSYTGPLNGTHDASKLSIRKKSVALVVMGKAQIELEQGLKLGNPALWGEAGAYRSLMKICNGREEAGLAYMTDYVRRVAVFALQHPGYRGIVLLQNARGKDEESYRLGIEALQEAAVDGGLEWREAHEALDVIRQNITANDPDRNDTLRELAIDMLAQLRDRQDVSFNSHTYEYVLAATQLALAFRDLDRAKV